MAHAIDRKAMVDNLVKGVSKVVNAACFPSQFGCTEAGLQKYDYDPAKAKKLLAEAGYPNGFTTDFYAYRERPYAEAMINYLQAVGIRAKLHFLRYPAFNDKVLNGKTPLYFYTWGSEGVNDVSGITSYFFEGGAEDYARDPKVEQWLESGDTTVAKSKRKADYAKALQRISEKAYWAPLFSYSINYAFSKDLEFTPSKDGIPRFVNAQWK